MRARFTSSVRRCRRPMSCCSIRLYIEIVPQMITRPRSAVAGWALIALALLACDRAPQDAPPRPGPDGLVAALAPVVGDRARAARVIAGMELPEAAWPRLVSAPYAAQRAAYVQAYPVATAGQLSR